MLRKSQAIDSENSENLNSPFLEKKDLVNLHILFYLLPMVYVWV